MSSNSFIDSILPAGVTADEAYVYMAGIAAFMAVFATGNTLFVRNFAGGRLKALKERRALLKGEISQANRRRKPETSVNWMRQVVNRFQLLGNEQVKQAGEMLIEAGWRSKDALIVFAFCTFTMPILFGLVGLTAMGLSIWPVKFQMARFAAPIAGVYFGLKLPAWTAAFKRRKRYRRIQRSLADTLDLMTICAEAGLSLAAALDRVSRELSMTYPEMAEEMSLTSMELGLLPERSQAMINLTHRVKLPEIRGIVSVLVQTEKYGTPISQAMRVLSQEFRTQRMLRAENKAARLPAIMTIPMIMFILPTLFIVVITPAIIRAMDNWK